MLQSATLLVIVAEVQPAIQIMLSMAFSKVMKLMTALVLHSSGIQSAMHLHHCIVLPWLHLYFENWQLH